MNACIRTALALSALVLSFVFDGATRAAAPAMPAQQPAAGALGSAPAPLPPPAPWPRTYVNNGNTLVLYAPQVDSWADYDVIKFRMAFALTLAGSGQTDYGVAAVQANTIVDYDARTVLMTGLTPVVRFPGMPEAQVPAATAIVKQCLPSLSFVDVSLDQVLAYMHTKVKPATVAVNLDPPPIFYSEVPAIMVIFMGPPQFKPVAGTQVLYATNANWPMLKDLATSQYYLLDGKSWLTTPDPLKGPWMAATSLPASFAAMPTDGNWTDILQNLTVTPFQTVPQVFATTQPSEIIVTNGPPQYTPIAGTRLMYINNPDTTVFLDLIDYNYYFLTSGRWFRATNLSGPWTAASANLPAEFAKIPPDSPAAFVLASVPGTQEAADAILLAQVPRKATINIAQAKVEVAYVGAPVFVPIQGTTMTYATNTTYQVICASGQYYCCSQGVWFVAPVSTGPYVVCTAVPQVIYTIPPTCPVYNVTYVQVYSSTPTTVVVGSTSGYSGEYVAATGALMFGMGMLTGALLASNNNYCCPPPYYSYGCAAHYSYGYGGYYSHASSYYGPYGTATGAAGYNPATGTYARAGSVSTASGSAWGAQAYNPYTNSYAQHTGSTNGYSSSGSSYYSNGSYSAQASHQSNPYGSAGEASNSNGQWAEGAHSNATDTSVAKTSNGDVYASHDGNVYKSNGDGSYQKYEGGGSWSDPTTPKPPASSSSSSWQSGAQSHPPSTAQSNYSSSGSSSWNKSSSSGSSSDSWSQHDTQAGLNSDAYARQSGSQNASSSQASRSGGSSSGWGSHSSGGSSGGWGGHSGGGGGWGGGGGGGGWGGRGGGGGGRR